MNFVFTVCGDAKEESCPVWPGQPMTAHWGIVDHAEPQGNAEEFIQAFGKVFLTLERRIGLFLSLPLASLEKLSIHRLLDRIGEE